jgi:hypothetical protein
VEGYISGLEYYLLKVVFQQMNMTHFHVPKPLDCQIWSKDELVNFQKSMTGKEIYVALGELETYFFVNI